MVEAAGVVWWGEEEEGREEGVDETRRLGRGRIGRAESGRMEEGEEGYCWGGSVEGIEINGSMGKIDDESNSRGRR